MKVISKYYFQGNPTMGQLSFPAGAEITATSGPIQGGWVFGSYAGQSGWFPESYVETAPARSRFPAPPLQPKRVAPQPQQAQPKDSPPRAVHFNFMHKNLKTIAETTESPSSSLSSLSRGSTSPQSHTGNDRDLEAFHMMGGTPGDLFEGAPKPVYYTTEECSSSPAPFLKEPEEKPVDIYRHAPSKKQNYAADYSPEIVVQMTSKAPANSSDPTNPSRQVLFSPTSIADFWKAHPSRAPGPTSAEQSYTLEMQALEVERAFQDLRCSETIEIVAEKKKRFPYIPNAIKNAAKKTMNAVKKH